MADINETEREQYEFIVPEEAENTRLDVLLTQLIGDNTSRTRVQNMIKDGFVTLNDKVCTLPREKVFANQKIVVNAPVQELVTYAKPEDIPLDIMYEDDAILVVNKPAGMVVHPGAGNWSGTLVNAVLGREAELLDDDEMDPLRPGIVHRLDKDTSGALVIAKNPVALRKLSRQFAEREVEKTYLAIVHGAPVPAGAVIRTAFGRSTRDRKKMAVLREGEGREAVTAYSTAKTGVWKGIKCALLKVRLHTGRTHQIRVHMSHQGNPLLGEKLYNRGRSSPAERQMLHAWKLVFVHPFTKEELEFEAPIPDDFRAVLDAMGNAGK